MFTVETRVAISAPPERVWQVLLDFERYREWNPLLDYLGGEPAVGERLTLKLNPPSGNGYTFRPVVTSRIENRLFSWIGVTFVRGVFDGEHFFELEPTGNGRTLLTNREAFSGLLAPLMQRTAMLRGAEPGFKSMNELLKHRVEDLARC